MDQQTLVNTVNQIKYIGQHRKELLQSDQAHYQVTKLTQLNTILVGAVVADLTDQCAAKTIKKHHRRLESYLNDYWAENLVTFSEDIFYELDAALYDGFSLNEIKEVKSALKKLLVFVQAQKLISDSDYQKWHQQLSRQAKFDPKQIPAATDALLVKYCCALTNLSGLLPCDQAFRIINHQASSLKLTADQFRTFLAEQSGFTQQRQFYVSRADGIPVIVTRDCRELADQLYDAQMLRRYWIPNKATLFKFAQNDYIADERVIGHYRDWLVKNFAMTMDFEVQLAMHLTKQAIRASFSQQPGVMFNNLLAAFDNYGWRFADQAAYEKFARLLMAVHNAVPHPELRGYSPNGVHKRMDQVMLPKLLLNKKHLSKDLEQALRTGEFDPLELVLFVRQSGKFTPATQQTIIDEVMKLNLPTLEIESF